VADELMIAEAAKNIPFEIIRSERPGAPNRQRR
jgi:hypothetical protein